MQQCAFWAIQQSVASNFAVLSINWYKPTYAVNLCIMKFYSKGLQILLDKWPGKSQLGVYRFLPLFFLLGAGIEFSMIHWKVGVVNFCE